MRPDGDERWLNTATLPMTAPLILASGSMARARMLRAAGVPFTALRPEVDEEAARIALAAAGTSTEDAAVALAALKARAVTDRVEPGQIVLASDQLLELEAAWLAKPADREAARRQLTAMRGRAHRLVSGVTAFRSGAEIWRHVDVATVTFRAFTPAFLESYLADVAPETLGSVGGYHAEGAGAQLIERIEGDWFTVMGMPLFPLLAFLRGQGVLER